MDYPSSFYTCTRCKRRVQEPDPCECEELDDDTLDAAEAAEEASREAEWDAMESRRSCRD